MSKEYLEALETLKNMLIGNGVNDNINDYVDNLILPIKQALLELKSIKEANPSEALECLEYIENKLKDLEYIAKKNDNEYLLSKYIPSEKFNSIKQALLKAQEPKHYLKWEDLEFKHTPKTIDVKMNGTKYTLNVGCNVHFDKLAILRNGKINYYFLEADKQFFNDLHLERVEE